jgi:hypothetical protein
MTTGPPGYEAGVLRTWMLHSNYVWISDCRLQVENFEHDDRLKLWGYIRHI